MLKINGFYNLLIKGKNLTDAEIRNVKEIYEKIGQSKMYTFLKEKKILPFGARTFLEYNIDCTFWQPVLESYRERNLKILTNLSNVYTAFHKFGVKKVFVSENFGALLSSNEDLALFASGDIDNYADYSEKDKIYAAFQSIGYRKKERYTGHNLVSVEFIPEDKTIFPDDFRNFDIAFYPLSRLKLPCFVNADDFVDWNKLWNYKGTSINLPNPDALMYICMLHVTLHSFSRAPDIRLYIDLLNMTKLPINYNKIAEWGQRDKTCTRLSVSSDLSNRLLQTKIPETVTNLSNRRDRLEKVVYNKSCNDLIYEPKGLKILKIEIMCDDLSDLHGIKEILFPNTLWMKRTYDGTNIVSYMRHFKKVLF